jgi:hypothetical protein
LPTYAEIVPALRWFLRRLTKARGFTAEHVVAWLRDVPYEEIPDGVWPSVRAFRKLRTDARIHVTRKYLGALESRRRKR